MTIEEDMFRDMKQQFPDIDFSEGTVAYHLVTRMANVVQQQYDSIKVALENSKVKAVLLGDEFDKEEEEGE